MLAKSELTKQELKWMEERKHRLLWSGVYSNPCLSGAWKIFLAPDYKDAAEFEARCAKILAKSPCFECQEKRKYGPNALSCIKKLTREGAEACRLKHARIRAEQEMEAEQC